MYRQFRIRDSAGAWMVDVAYSPGEWRTLVWFSVEGLAEKYIAAREEGIDHQAASDLAIEAVAP